jgi:hypothetical protein
MAKDLSQNKTEQTAIRPREYIEQLDNATRRSDALILLKWFERTTQMPPVMWGPSIVGYGRYYYQYDSGRTGESMITGFSPRKSNLSIYIMPGYQELGEQLQLLGKHKVGKSCLYVNKLADIDLGVLEEMVQYNVDYMKSNYKTWKK